MSDTKIEWASKVWNPVVGCSIHSPGCTNCYAMKMAWRLQNMASKADGSGNVHLDHYEGTVQQSRGGPVWTGKVNVAPEEVLTAPLRRRKPTDYFVNSMSDLFHVDVPDEVIDRVFAVMALCPQHTFKVLTKRSARMREYCDRKTSASGAGAVADQIAALGGGPGAQLAFMERIAEFSCLPNVWLGVSVEDQKRADERIPDLLATPAAVRWLSCEPLLGPVDLRRAHLTPTKLSRVDWVVAGGESGPGARPMHPDWARSLRDQCADADVPFFFKQWGEWKQAIPRPSETPGKFAMMARDPSGWTHSNATKLDHYPRQFNCFGSIVLECVGKKSAGRLLDGREWNEMPEVAHG